MPLALKARFTVQAGVIPGQAMEEYTKSWLYTSVDWEADAALPAMPEGYELDRSGPLDQPHMSRFTRMMFEMERYAGTLIHPARCNWVRTEWLWI